MAVTDLKQIAVEINGLLSRYVEVHDAIFKFSWRKIIPLPFIFRPIACGHLHSRTEQILSQLEICNQQISSLVEDLTQRESSFSDFLSKYCTALIETVSILKEITHQLRLKSEGSGEYSLTEHRRQCALYENAIDTYTTMGSRLNELYQEIA